MRRLKRMKEAVTELLALVGTIASPPVARWFQLQRPGAPCPPDGLSRPNRTAKRMVMAMPRDETQPSPCSPALTIPMEGDFKEF